MVCLEAGLRAVGWEKPASVRAMSSSDWHDWMALRDLTNDVPTRVICRQRQLISQVLATVQRRMQVRPSWVQGQGSKRHQMLERRRHNNNSR